MKYLILQAEHAARQVLGDVSGLRYVETSEADEQVFAARMGFARVTITINPNGRRATVEWPGETQTNYRICQLPDPAAPDEVITAEASS
jgi:hypothetical protein